MSEGILERLDRIDRAVLDCIFLRSILGRRTRLSEISEECGISEQETVERLYRLRERRLVIIEADLGDNG